MKIGTESRTLRNVFNRGTLELGPSVTDSWSSRLSQSDDLNHRWAEIRVKNMSWLMELKASDEKRSLATLTQAVSGREVISAQRCLSSSGLSSALKGSLERTEKSLWWRCEKILNTSRPGFCVTRIGVKQKIGDWWRSCWWQLSPVGWRQRNPQHVSWTARLLLVLNKHSFRSCSLH